MSAQVADATQRLDGLAAATSLDRPGVLPWRLQVTFTLNDLTGKAQDSGTAEVHWTGQGHETIEINSTLLHGELPKDDAAFVAGTTREVYLLRLMLDQTIRPVPSFKGGKEISVVEQKRKFGKVELSCLMVTRDKAPSGVPDRPGNEFCTEPSDPNLLRIRFEPSVAMIRNRMAKFQNISVALDNTISYFGNPAIMGHTESLKVDPTSTPADSAQQPSAPDTTRSSLLPPLMLAGHKTGGVPPEYPAMARQNHVSGSVILAAVIDKTGHIKDLAPIASPDPWLTLSAVAAVKTWTYTPYLLNGEATEVATTITVNYNLSGG